MGLIKAIAGAAESPGEQIPAIFITFSTVMGGEFLSKKRKNREKKKNALLNSINKLFDNERD